MSEKGTYSDPRCYCCKPAPASNVLEDEKVEALMKQHLPGWMTGEPLDLSQYPPFDYRIWNEAVDIRLRALFDKKGVVK